MGKNSKKITLFDLLCLNVTILVSFMSPACFAFARPENKTLK
jgi:hypothetical protein